MGATQVGVGVELCEQVLKPQVLKLLPRFSPEAMEISSHQPGQELIEFQRGDRGKI